MRNTRASVGRPRRPDLAANQRGRPTLSSSANHLQILDTVSRAWRAPEALLD
ncbi:MAG: hypothetical protein LC777_15220 [Actinobacteria bacterium]|nr:hypothetical protein [Actinomycetota bacterium]